MFLTLALLAASVPPGCAGGAEADAGSTRVVRDERVDEGHAWWRDNRGLIIGPAHPLPPVPAQPPLYDATSPDTRRPAKGGAR